MCKVVLIVWLRRMFAWFDFGVGLGKPNCIMFLISCVANIRWGTDCNIYCSYGGLSDLVCFIGMVIGEKV